ncbi:glycoside hydrolase family 95 protein [Ceratobasidium sp. AG-Ba]|nr:glycoside hydrolase family 95 protein [Ceratobasidium sp. AG-Ba]
MADSNTRNRKDIALESGLLAPRPASSSHEVITDGVKCTRNNIDRLIIAILLAWLGLGFHGLFRTPKEVVIGLTPARFPESGNVLWYNRPAINWVTEFLPIGNGYLGVMVNGNPTSDRLQLNIESLWSGGPFADPKYNGGNHPPSEAEYISKQFTRIREELFNSTRGTIPDVRPLPHEAGAYAGYFSIDHVASGNVSNYARWLDMDTAVLKTIWTESSGSYDRTYFCSNPSRACTVHTVASNPGAFSAIFRFTPLPDLPPPVVTCLDTTTLQIRGRAGSPGMLFEILATIQDSGPRNSTSGCGPDRYGNSVLYAEGSTEAWISWVGGTEYSMDSGNPASGYTFKGVDPHLQLVGLVTNLATQSVGSALAIHITDYRSALGGFSLNIGQTPDLVKTTEVLSKEYRKDIGDPYFEWLLFNYGRYMLISSTRSDIPTNLQGKWSRDSAAPWSGDYHANINTQMNYWIAEMTNMKVTSSLWNYMEKTWAPRGAETAKTLYNITRGWVVHNEMNIFGHTGMKGSGFDNTATWANYPEAAAWMMIHVYDHFDYTNDVTWWREQGWPMLKGIASFWLDHLVEDTYFNDGTLVTAPCNSPEQNWITLGCSHSQQLIWQLFEAVEKGFSDSGDKDWQFLADVQSKKLQLDKGIRIGSFGQLQEWKVELDNPADLHRHLSHLIGLYPGYVLTNFKQTDEPHQGLPELTREQVLRATEVTLISRGDGTGPDGDAGWEKVWRAACWAQLQNATRFYHQLTYAIERNFAPNLLSLYNYYSPDPIFQIDANFGYPAALLNALVQAPDTSSLFDPLPITILPALPPAWSNGSFIGTRIRGGMTLDLTWTNGRPIQAHVQVDKVVRHARQVEIWYNRRLVTSFRAKAGSKQEVKF